MNKRRTYLLFQAETILKESQLTAGKHVEVNKTDRVVTVNGATVFTQEKADIGGTFSADYSALQGLLI